MGIQLKWEIEAEPTQPKDSGEDPEGARSRRMARLRLLTFIVGTLGIIGLLVGFVMFRLNEINTATENLLRQTVDAEVAALRIGDRNSFLSMQHANNPAWLLEQGENFDLYQSLKLEQNISLTGRIIDITVDDTRGRVHVEEIIGGIPYTRVWFYWRFSDGWLHVPADYTFWGELLTVEGENVTMRYGTVDEPLGLEMGLQLEDWVNRACSALMCEGISQISVDIVPGEVAQMVWAPNNPWQLIAPSPYTDRARSDMPFDVELQLEAANLLADRLVGYTSDYIQPAYPADAYYLRSAIVSWLVGRFVHIDTNSFLIDSLARNYGEQTVGWLVQSLQPSSDVSLFTSVAGVSSLEQANLDWRDLLTWRLTTEDELISRRDLDNLLRLYDTTDALVLSTAHMRFDANLPGEQKVVTLVLPGLDTSGRPQLSATVQIGQRQEEVLFRLVDGVWKRAS